MEGDCEGRVGVAFGLERRQERWGWHKAASTCITRKACIVYWFIDLADSGRIGLEAYYYFSTARSLFPSGGAHGHGGIPRRVSQVWSCPRWLTCGSQTYVTDNLPLHWGCGGMQAAVSVPKRQWPYAALLDPAGGGASAIPRRNSKAGPWLEGCKPGMVCAPFPLLLVLGNHPPPACIPTWIVRSPAWSIGNKLCSLGRGSLVRVAARPRFM